DGDEFIADYRALIDAFREANPACRILVARLSPISNLHPRFESGTRDWHGQIQKCIEVVAEHAGAQLIDFHAPLYAFPRLLPDGLHPDAEGAGILADVVRGTITGDYGGLRMGPLYTDGMVLQRDRRLPVRGVADAGERVTVRIAGQRRETVAGSDGRWEVALDPLPAGGPHTLTIATPARKLAYRDVLVGEVWLCSGQSNMQFALRYNEPSERDAAAENDAQLRLFDMKGDWRMPVWDAPTIDSIDRLRFYRPARWAASTSENAPEFSAVAYYFGRRLRDSLNVPVGLVCNAVGGSPTEAWVDRRTLEYEFPAILRDWRRSDFVQQWVRETADSRLSASDDRTHRHPFGPCYLFETGIAPLDGFPVRGVIWYQGESNAHNIEAHERLFGLLVKSWRTCWNDPELPFYFVQLSSLNRPSWPRFRDSQRRLLERIPHTGMAVCSDRGDSLDVHPTRKRDVGERLAAWALHADYGRRDVVPSGPLFRSLEVEGDTAYVSFDWSEGLHADGGGALRTFEAAGADGLFHPAEARVEGDRVAVRSDRVPHPVAVRYGWQPFTRANLVNGAGLPASTFAGEVR
ncbi:MAG: sialate O-acetylesterase, partial [Alistipes sp.]|nr:sialate O-acetylesterase [Alistipes sp.]